MTSTEAEKQIRSICDEYESKLDDPTGAIAILSLLDEIAVSYRMRLEDLEDEE